MNRFQVAPEVFEKIPNACFGVVVAKNINNSHPISEISVLLQNTQKDIFQQLAGRKAKEYPPILPYRETFQKLSINPNKYPPSVEALISRIEKGKELPAINPAVDLGNAISLKYGIPLGAHDLQAAAEPLEVRLYHPGDQFVPFGATEPEVIEADEILYASGSQVKTRRWIWRQSEFGKITAATTDIFFPLDGFSDINASEVLAARDELARLLAHYFQTESQVFWITKEQPSCSF